jgi:hypothetical protein
MFKKDYARVALACAAVASLGLLVGVSPAAAKAKKKTVTKTATVTQCANGPAAIPDDPDLDADPAGAGALGVPISVPKFKGKSQDGLVTGITSVGVRITHTYDSDLIIALVSPGGKIAELFHGRGTHGEDFGSGPGCSGTPVLFGDAFPTPINSLTGTNPNPITGSFKPEQPFSTFVGGPARGFWTLVATDKSNGDVGTIDAITMNLTYTYKAQVKKKGKK